MISTHAHQPPLVGTRKAKGLQWAFPSRSGSGCGARISPEGRPCGRTDVLGLTMATSPSTPPEAGGDFSPTFSGRTWCGSRRQTSWKCGAPGELNSVLSTLSLQCLSVIAQVFLPSAGSPPRAFWSCVSALVSCDSLGSPLSPQFGGFAL